MATLGIDVSSWQDNNSTTKKIDWNLAHANGAVFAFIRCCNGFTADEDFEYNWAAAKEAGLLRGAYLFHDYRVSPSGQAKFFASRLKADPGELPPVLDVEKYWQPYPARTGWLAAIQTMISTLKNEGHARVTFYSNPDAILYSLSPIPDYLSSLPLWIAHYGADQPSTKAVAPWGRWTFWQHTATGDGLAFGMESKGLDMDWFNGTEAELYAFAGKTLPDSGNTTTELTTEEKVALLWKAHPELWPK
jgi:lysozyme